MGFRFRHAICNEGFEKRPLAEVCQSVRTIGYEGIEIAPFTLAEKPADISAGQRREYRETIESSGLQFAGLHWLLASPAGLHVTTADRETWTRSWRHVGELIELCADLGDNGVMVFGSPKQRGTTNGMRRDEATRRFTEGLAGVADHAASRGVTILVEALPQNQCDLINTLDEAAALVREISSPGVRTMFDTHNAVDEPPPHSQLIERHFDLIRHVHVNEVDGRHPGTGQYDFKSVLETLQRLGYQHWVSLEAFDFRGGAEKIAADSLRFLEAEIARIKE